MSQPASLRCAYARAGNYDLVWWIAAEEPTSIPDQFAALAARLGLGGAADTDALRDQVHDALRGVPGWLLIFDNADAADDIAPWLPAVPLPPGIPGDVIVTTRRAGFSALGQVLDLDVRDLAAAVRLLRSRVPDLGQDAGEQIAQELGRLPLALEQAAVYLELSQMPGLEYLEPLHSRAAELYTRGKVASHTDTVATLWDISLKRRCRGCGPAGPRRHGGGPGRPFPGQAVALALLRASAPEQIMGAPQDWPRWAVLLPHVLPRIFRHCIRAAAKSVTGAVVLASWPGGRRFLARCGRCSLKCLTY